MSVLHILYSTFQYVLFFYFSYTTLYNFILSISSIFTRKLTFLQNNKHHKFCVLIPAYKEDGVIIETAKKALLQKYPSDKFQVYIIADSLKKDTLDHLYKLPVEVITVAFENSTKVKALNAAFASITSDYDACVILDADNNMETNFLARADKLLTSNYASIQGQRLPKNMETTMSFLDGLSEAINTNIFRKGTFNLGLSSSISGSGYVANFKILKGIIAEMDSVSGFDKELEIKLLLRGISTIYCHDLIIYEEKVSTRQDFKNQRKRWIYSQYFYLVKYFPTSVQALFQLNITLLNSSFLRYAQLPRFLNLVFLLLFTALFSASNFILNRPFYGWWIVLSINILSIFVAIPKKYYSRKLLMAVWQLPATFITMAGIMFRLKGTNKKYIHTPHGKGKN